MGAENFNFTHKFSRIWAFLAPNFVFFGKKSNNWKQILRQTKS